VDAEPDPHADLDRLGRDVLDPAHQPKALVTINEGDVIRYAFARMGDGRRIDGAEAGADPPFEPVAASERADDTRVEHRPSRLRAPLVSQLAAFEVRLIKRQR